MADPAQQVETVIRLVKGKTWKRPSPQFTTCVNWLDLCLKSVGTEGQIVTADRAQELFKVICESFNIGEVELKSVLSGVAVKPATNGQPTINAEQELENKLPKEGWLHEYIEYTRYTESPLSFHIFCSLAVLGAAVGRHIYRDKGHFKIYPNMRVILVAPPGRCRKSTAIGIAHGLVSRANLCPVMATKITPEALIEALEKHGPHQFIAASELSVFMGKQKYMEGMVPIILKLLDDEDKAIEIRTMSRNTVVENHALTVLSGSTMSLLTDSTAAGVSSSGFLSRFITVVENDTMRCFPDPIKGHMKHENYLLTILDRVKLQSGIMDRTPEANEWWKDYYNEQWKLMKEVNDETTAQIIERVPIHLERIAMLLHLADCNTRSICMRCMVVAHDLITYAQRHTDEMSRAINASVRSQDSVFVLSQIQRMGGVIDHSKLLRMVSGHGIDAAGLKKAIQTLVEENRVKEDRRQGTRWYVLNEEGGHEQ